MIAKAQALDLATGTATDEFNDKLAELRRQLGELRKNAGFNPGMGAALGVIGTGNQPDPATIKPELKVKADMGHIRITGRKNYAQTVNIYTRLRPVAAWRLLVAKRKTFPFDDQTPPAQAGIPEEREYMARGVIGDTEIGLPSDIVTATFTP